MTIFFLGQKRHKFYDRRTEEIIYEIKKLRPHPGRMLS